MRKNGVALVPAQESSNFTVVHNRLLALLIKDAGDDDQVLPTPTAFNRTLSLLDSAFQTLPHLFPRASVTATETGGIRVQWIGDDRQVRLVIPAGAAEENYLYYETADTYDLQRGVTASDLSDYLLWFMGVNLAKGFQPLALSAFVSEMNVNLPKRTVPSWNLGSP